jgi:hypothetical protein
MYEHGNPEDPMKDMSIADIRSTAIIAELGHAASEYRRVLRDFEVARQRLEVAKEKFNGVRRIALDVLPSREYSEWQHNNEDIWLIGMEIGEAIRQALHERAATAAMDALDSKGDKPYDPWMTSPEIVDALSARGFEFRTATPRREVHAALLHLRGIKKTTYGRFALRDADAIYSDMKATYESQGISTIKEDNAKADLRSDRGIAR